jgi:6-methylsalicylate decarboxylase
MPSSEAHPESSAAAAPAYDPANMRWIDVHQHPVLESYRTALEGIGVMGSGENPWPRWSVAAALEIMDERGIAGAMLSVGSPGAWFGNIEFTKSVVSTCNEDLARIVADQPRRFGAFGFLPLPDVAAASRAVEHVLDKLQLDGVTLLTHTDDRYVGHPDEWELYDELDRRKALVFIHPVRPPRSSLPQLQVSIGYTELVFETTRAIANLIGTGALERFSNIRFIMPHAGGTAPFLLFRLAGMEIDPMLRDRMPNGVAASLRRFYYDVAQSAAVPSLCALMKVATPEQIMFGSDYPFALRAEQVLEDTMNGVRDFEGFDTILRRKVARENAVGLLPRFADPL